MNSMKRSLLSHIDGRKGERLVQGLMVYASQDRIFRDALSTFFGWPTGAVAIDEEEPSPDGVQRYDLIFRWSDQEEKKYVELKIVYSFTGPQIAELFHKTRPHVIDALLLPRSCVHFHHRELERTGLVVRTWEDFERVPAASTPEAQLLFHGLVEHLVGVDHIDKKTALAALTDKSYEVWFEPDGVGYEFYRFLSRLWTEVGIRFPDVRVSDRFSGRPQADAKWNFYGFYIYPIEQAPSESSLWVGFISNNETSPPFIEFIVQLFGRIGAACGIRPCSGEKHPWGHFASNQICVQNISPNENGLFQLEQVIQKISPFLMRLSERGKYE